MFRHDYFTYVYMYVIVEKLFWGKVWKKDIFCIFKLDTFNVC
jgi:hypothetical protein